MNDTSNEKKAAAIFEATMDLPTQDRPAAIAAACGDDAALAARVAALHAGARAAQGFLSDPTMDAASALDAAPLTERPGLVIGRYKLLQQIGEGGFGVVFMAEQEVPVKRRVALKVIKAGMDTRAVIARFEAERQALAMMDHPNIAKVLDAGATDAGRPYFVMELVKGIPITDYCDQANLAMRPRLELFLEVCRAVQHAHQKGIIHRDLKPSNVMVTLHDARPVVKVIDFGIAKATEQKLTEKTLFTNFGQMIGTPQYMSPEQAVISALDVDTRSDVYSLGVLLYELLAGSTPFDARTLRSAGYDEMRRIIQEEQPSKPSTKLSTLSPDLKLSVAARRQVSSQLLGRQLRGDLDWIVLKAIEKDRNRRYESASAFAEDVQRHLNSEPVSAGAPGAGYRLRKFVRRNRGPLGVAVVIAALLLAGTTVSTWQAIRATRAENVTRLAQQEADARRIDAERQKNRAEAGEKLAGDRLVQVETEKKNALAEKKNAVEEKQIAQSVEDFLQNKLLSQTDTFAQANALLRAGQPSSEAKLNPTIHELLDRAARELAPDKIEESFPHQPLVQAEILQTIGTAYGGIGEYQSAIDFLKRSAAIRRQLLGSDNPQTLLVTNKLALAYQAGGHPQLAVPLLEGTLKLMKVTLGLEDPDTLRTMSCLASAYEAAGEVNVALPLFEQVVKLQTATLGPDNPETLDSMSCLAWSYQAAGKRELALPLFQETLRLMKEKLGPEHPQTLTSMNNLALAYLADGKLELALPLLEETLKLRKAKLGPEHPDTLTTAVKLAWAYQASGKLGLAIPLLEETLGTLKAKLGPDHPYTLGTMYSLAQAYQAAGKLDLAVPMFEQTLKFTKAKLGPDHPNTLRTMCSLAQAYREDGKLDLALPMFEEAIKLMKVRLGPEHPDTLRNMGFLAQAYQANAQLDLALPLYEETLKLQRDTLGPENPDTLYTMKGLASFYDATKQFGKADLLYRERLGSIKQRSGANSPAYAGELSTLGFRLLHQQKWADAEPWLRECLTIRQKVQPDDWSTFNAQSQLGASLLGQQKYAAAEPLLLAGYNGMKQREKMIPPQGMARLTDAIDRLIELYTATNSPDEVKKWQAERAMYPT